MPPTNPLTKTRISSPLEAGPSLLDSKYLPPELISAMEYVSTRLAQKHLHLSLIVVRRDAPVPTYFTPPTSPSLSPTLSSPASSNPISSTGSLSPANFLSRTGYPSLPPRLRRKNSSPVSISSESSSPTLSQCSSTPGITSQNPYGISLMHAATLTVKAEKILRHYIAKSEKKFSIGSGWLSSHPLSSNIDCTKTNDLIRRSLSQNEILFSSKGLTLLSLDHVYTFKCYLHTYSSSLSLTDLTSSVDELRRLVLTRKGLCITKGYLMRAYDWLGVSLAALVDVNEGYKKAYGGKERLGGIEIQNEERQSPPPLKTNFTVREVKMMKIRFAPYIEDADTSGTSSGNTSDDEVQFGESAKRKGMGAWGTSTMPWEVQGWKDRGPHWGGSKPSTPPSESWEGKEDRGPHRRGPRTPNGFEDITPVTQGEWHHLMVGDSWKTPPKTIGITTC